MVQLKQRNKSAIKKLHLGATFFVLCYYRFVNKILKTIKKEEQYYFEEKKSKFYSFIFPVNCEEKCKRILDDFRKEYSDARHILWAYSIDGNLKKNNDGEPTGAQAILNAINFNMLDNVLIIVVRYFGGILLGAGGLFRAYGNAASEVIKKCEIVSLKKYNVVEVYLDYNNYLQFYDKYNVLESAFEEKVVLTLAVDDIELETIKDYNYKIIGERLL